MFNDAQLAQSCRKGTACNTCGPTEVVVDKQALQRLGVARNTVGAGGGQALTAICSPRDVQSVFFFFPVASAYASGTYLQRGEMRMGVI